MKNRYVICSPSHDDGINKGRKFFSSRHEAEKYMNTIVGFALIVDLKKNANRR